MPAEFTNSNLEVLLSNEQITTRIKELGAEITNDYAGQEPILIGVLKGAFVFMADLARSINLKISIEFMAVSSYGKAQKSSGEVKIIKDLDVAVEGKDLIVVEDIVDTGLTLSYLLQNLQSRGAKSVRLATLLDKPEPRINKDLKINYCGFQVPNKFVVGYGLDAAERYRNLPFIAVVRNPEIV
ncbi:MAG: hypoxanthine phosphoribosyltransferase [Acidobacteriota bacterium]|jgi:hypoxanthine phosphoribosyltransferase|nr:hypoxanthine phosphoribosyltransferase [Acidobacteriota bacterium]MDQ3374387.1 hypoxanthine phosphoribosyltransferase [Acidobacteriota bacterium]